METVKSKPTTVARTKRTMENTKPNGAEEKLWKTLEMLQRNVGKKIDSIKLVKEVRG